MANFAKVFRQTRRFLSKDFRRKLPCEIKVVGASLAESRRLNRVYLKKNKPANVLSFRYWPDVSTRGREAKEGYGEIIVCPQVIRRDAKKHGNSYQYQLRWMILHGLLHLAGLNHEKSSKERKRFEKLEQKLLNNLMVKH